MGGNNGNSYKFMIINNKINLQNIKIFIAPLEA